MNDIVVKKYGEVHFSVNFGERSKADRVIVPDKDRVRVKVTRVMQESGLSKQGIVYACDETVHILTGRLTLHRGDVEDIVLCTGDTFHIPAGTVFGITALVDTFLFCIFSPGADGTLPDSK